MLTSPQCRPTSPLCYCRMVWRTAVYNPCSLVQPYRSHHLSAELRSLDAFFVFLMILEPEYLTKPKRSLAGIGAEDDAPAVLTMTGSQFNHTLVHTRRSRCPPCDAHRSQVWKLDYGNGKLGAFGMRVIHGLCAFWRSMYKYWVDCTETKITFPSYDCGALPCRRREDAMLGSRVTAERLRNARIDFFANSRDMANAFGSSEHQCLNSTMLPTLRSIDRPLFSHRRESSVLRLDSAPSTFQEQRRLASWRTASRSCWKR